MFRNVTNTHIIWHIGGYTATQFKRSRGESYRAHKEQLFMC